MKKSSHDSRLTATGQFNPGVIRGLASASDCRHGAVIEGVSLAEVAADLPAPRVRRELSLLFGLLGNETRVSLLLALAGPEDLGDAARELCVCDLAALVGTSPSMTSHQLRLLREHGLVRQRRTGKRMMYSLAAGPLGHLLRDAMEHVGAVAPSDLQRVLEQ